MPAEAATRLAEGLARAEVLAADDQPRFVHPVIRAAFEASLGRAVIVEEGTFTGTHRGVLHSPAGDIPPTGRRVTVDYIHVLRYRDGQHISFNLMFDRLLMLEQLGLVPAPAARA